MQKWAPYILLATAQAALASNVIIGKYVLEELPTFIFLGIRFLVSSLLLSVIMLLVKNKVASQTHPVGILQMKDWGFLIGQALTGGFLYNVLFYQGIKFTTATDAGIISSTLPAMIAVFAFLFLKEKLDQKKVIAILLAILGIAVINLDIIPSKELGINSLLGNGLVLLAMVPEAIYSIFNKFISPRIHPLGGSVVVSWVVFIMLLPLMWLELTESDLSQIPPYHYTLSAIAGFFSAFFFLAWTKGLATISASSAAIFGGVLPIVTALLGWYFLGESFTWYTMVGISLVFSSLAMGIKWRRTKRMLVDAKRPE
jgi:drug/metabolite transporter (DMT)-like permease